MEDHGLLRLVDPEAVGIGLGVPFVPETGMEVRRGQAGMASAQGDQALVKGQGGAARSVAHPLPTQRAGHDPLHSGIQRIRRRASIVLRHRVKLGEFLAIVQHRRSRRGEQGDGIGLQPPPFLPAPGIAHDGLVIVILQVRGGGAPRIKIARGVQEPHDAGLDLALREVLAAPSAKRIEPAARRPDRIDNADRGIVPFVL